MLAVMNVKSISVYLLFVTILMVPIAAPARILKLGPKPEYTPTEVIQYWAGAVSTLAMKYCGNHKEGKKLKALVKDYEPAQFAFKQRAGFDNYRGSCAQINDEYLPMYLNEFETN